MNAESREEAARSVRYGRYVVLRELGRGGMATVFEGQHVELGKRAAIKVMFASLAVSTTAAARFLREARAVAQLRHPNIVDVFDMGTSEGTPYFVMELLEGSTLAKWLVEQGPVEPERIANLFLPVLSAVETAHRQGVIHRDLKPANIFVATRPNAAPHPMILDFGISKVVTGPEELSLTHSESLMGTVHYMSPEQTRGGSAATALSDQYSIGVMLYECATGTRPFAGASHYELMHAIVTAPVVPPSAINPNLPREFDEIVLRAMNRDPERRYPSAHALGNALLSFAGKVGWSLWGREFAGTASLDPGGANAVVGPSTDPDISESHAASTGPTARKSPTDESRKSRTSMWLAAALGVYAVVATALLLARSASESPLPRTVVALPPSASDPILGSPPVRSFESPGSPSASSEVTPLRSAVGALAATTPSAAHSTDAVADRAGVHPRRPSAGGKTPAGPAASASRPATEMGTNRAFIIP